MKRRRPSLGSPTQSVQCITHAQLDLDTLKRFFHELLKSDRVIMVSHHGKGNGQTRKDFQFLAKIYNFPQEDASQPKRNAPSRFQVPDS